MLKAVIFDLDGVITDTAEYHYLAWQKTAKKLQINFDREFNEELKGISRIDSIYKILEYGKVLDQFSQSEIKDLAAQKNLLYKDLIREITVNNILPGIKNFLQECQDAGLMIGLASASQNGSAILKRLGIMHLFDTIVDPMTLKKGKPHPEIFEKAASQLGVEVENCVGIEDAEAGVKSIKDAGIFAIGVGSVERMKQADWIIQTTQDLTLNKLKKVLCQKENLKIAP